MKFPDDLMNAGLLFVYIPKYFFGDAVKVLKKKEFKWVEKAIVIPRDLGSIQVRKMQSKKNGFIGVASKDLHIFRKLKKGRLPMMHQRDTNGRFLTGEDKMHYTYDLIEQMLHPGYRGQKNVKLLELHDIGGKREGWIQIKHRARREAKGVMI